MRVACFCGAVYDSDTDEGLCPYCGAVTDSPATVPADTAPPRGLPRDLLDANRRRLDELEASAPAREQRLQLAAWHTERRQIRESPQWAFAMGHGCSMGYLPTESRAVLQREQDLAALIAEHTPTERHDDAADS